MEPPDAAGDEGATSPARPPGLWKYPSEYAAKPTPPTSSSTSTTSTTELPADFPSGAPACRGT
jgi:hypothetical protein